MLVAVQAGYIVTLPGLHPLPAAVEPGGVPLIVADPPVWTDEVADAPPGPAALVLGSGRARPLAVPRVGLNLTGLIAVVLPFAVPATIAVAIVVLIWWTRRRQIERSAMPKPT